MQQAQLPGLGHIGHAHRTDQLHTWDRVHHLLQHVDIQGPGLPREQGQGKSDAKLWLIHYGAAVLWVL